MILYEIPRYGSHHFSLSYSNFSKKAKVPLKKPQWLDKLQLRNSVIDLVTLNLIYESLIITIFQYMIEVYNSMQDTVIVALNSSAAAEKYLKTDIRTKKCIWDSIASRYSLLSHVILSHYCFFIRTGIVIFVVAFQVLRLHVALVGYSDSYIILSILHYISVSLLLFKC